MTGSDDPMLDPLVRDYVLSHMDADDQFHEAADLFGQSAQAHKAASALYGKAGRVSTAWSITFAVLGVASLVSNYIAPAWLTWTMLGIIVVAIPMCIVTIGVYWWKAVRTGRSGTRLGNQGDTLARSASEQADSWRWVRGDLPD